MINFHAITRSVTFTKLWCQFYFRSPVNHPCLCQFGDCPASVLLLKGQSWPFSVFRSVKFRLHANVSWLKAWEGASALKKINGEDTILLYGKLCHNSCFFQKELGCAHGIEAAWSVNCLRLNINLEIWEYCFFTSWWRTSLVWTMRYFCWDKGTQEFYLTCYKRVLKKSPMGVILLEFPLSLFSWYY